jgi:GTP cyclohydrolase II
MEIASCNLPTRYGIARCYAFREPGSTENLAIVWKRDETATPLVRIHSECLTGDVIGSTRCDCGGQLHLALDALALAPYAILIYMRGHEGRGIGLFNKIRAYQRQQDLGEDTVDANINLGLPVDARSYEMAAQFLQGLSVSSVSLLTNNPLKVEAMRSFGIDIKHRVALLARFTAESEKYMATKVNRMGHLIEEVN